MEGDGDIKLTYQRMMESLQNGRLVWEDVSMFIVEPLGGTLTMNVNFGVTSMAALTVSTFAGENGRAVEMEMCRLERGAGTMRAWLIVQGRRALRPSGCMSLAITTSW